MKWTMQKKILNRFLISFGFVCSMTLSHALEHGSMGQMKVRNTNEASNAIAGGSYQNTDKQTWPLLANSHDGGSSWFYPATIRSNLPDTSKAEFNGAICNRLNCIASGYYKRVVTGNSKVDYPLLASSQDAGDTWAYPASIISALPVDFASGRFMSPPRCSGENCIAVGKYTTITKSNLPLLARSADGGLTWGYPETVLTHLPEDFLSKGVFYTSTSLYLDFFAAGQYRNLENKWVPLLSSSHDGGLTWSSPPSVLTNLPSDFSNNAIFNSMTCSDEACVAAGIYTSTAYGHPELPLIAVSHDLGTTWSYSNLSTVLPSDFKTLITLSSVSCNENCVAVGEYQSKKLGHPKYPFLIVSQDGGNHWIYPTTILTNLPTDFQKIGLFKGGHCNRNICIAVGQYQSNSTGKPFVPLLASSLDGGSTWIYPDSILSQLPSHFLNGILLDTHCNVIDCVAEGQYQSKNKIKYPLVASSHDAGVTWTYPPTVTSNLPSDFKDRGILTSGNSSFF